MLFLTTNTDGEQARAGYEELSELVAAVEALGERDGWSGELTFRISLVIDELAQNVVDYSHEGRLGDVEVEVTSLPEDVIIEIIDDGIPFDPLTEAPEPDLTSPIEDRPIGGLGVHFTKTLMDEVEYCRESGKNRLKMVARKAR
jgi:anti-sigma regulatory factor (Ser/Thr protein kinase)